MMPGRLGGREVFGCIDLDGAGRFSCEFRPGQWKECSARNRLRYTVEGEPCVFPFTSQGVQYNDCVPNEVSGEVCQIAAGELRECAPTSTQDTSRPPEAPPRRMAEVQTIVGRVTIDDEPCRFPWWFEGLSLGGCIDIAGLQTCESLNGTLETCAPVIYTLDRTPCVFPFPAESTMQFSCVEREGSEMCRVANGSWAMCEPPGRDFPVNAPLPLLPGRVTVNNESCLFPFWFEVRCTWIRGVLLC